MTVSGEKFSSCQEGCVELEAALYRYMDLYEFAPVGYLTLNTEGIIEQMNLAGANLLRFDRQELIGSRFDALVDPEYRNLWDQQFMLAVKYDTKLSCALALRRSKDDYCYVRLEFLRIMVDDRPVEVRIAIIDITTHKHDEERLKLALEGSKLGFWDVDLETGVTVVDTHYAEIFGYPPSLETNRDWWIKRIHPDDLAQVLETGRKYQEGKIDTYEIECRVFRPDGKMVWALSKGVAVARKKNGSPARMVGTAQDITDRKQSEERLLRKEKQFRALLESAPDPMVVSNAAGIITMVNQQAELLFGYRREEMLGQPVEMLLPEHMRTDHVQMRDKYLADVQPHHITTGRRPLLAYTKNGQTIPVEINLSPIETDDGLLMVSSLRDITERQKAEIKMAEAKMLADNANNAKSEFLAKMSHEIRTPMNAIIGMAYLALQTDLNAKQRNHVEKISAAAKNLLGIINDILDFSKIEAGKMHFEHIPFCLDTVIEQTADMSLQKAIDKGLKILFEVEEDVPTQLVGDPLRLEQVLVNLVNNAIKFTDTGEIWVRISKYHNASEQVYLRFAVTDNGIGLTAEQCNNLFRAFSQADTSTTRKYGGTGLGLTISKHLVNMMHGDIGVESQPGVGSTFHFTARFGVWTEQSNPPKRLVVPRSSEHTPTDHQSTICQLQGVRILLVEDNAINQELALELLQNVGINVDLACNGAEAIEKISCGHYDCVLMDCQMPVMDGFEATRRIRHKDKFATLPILAMTANAMTGDREKCLECGMNDHIAKPIDVAQLFSTILRWIQPPPACRPLDNAPKPCDTDNTNIPVISGLDIEGAMERLGGNAKLLHKIIRNFAATQANVIQRIEAALHSHNMATAIREAHTVKGLAGNIGATLVAELGARVEKVLKNGPTEQILPALQNFDIALTNILTQIAIGTTESPSDTIPTTTNPPIEVDLNALKTDLHQLQELLTDLDPDAMEVADNVGTRLRMLGQLQNTDMLLKEVAAFNYQEALKLLAVIMHESEKPALLGIP